MTEDSEAKPPHRRLRTVLLIFVGIFLSGAIMAVSMLVKGVSVSTSLSAIILAPICATIGPIVGIVSGSWSSVFINGRVTVLLGVGLVIVFAIAGHTAQNGYLRVTLLVLSGILLTVVGALGFGPQ